MVRANNSTRAVHFTLQDEEKKSLSVPFLSFVRLSYCFELVLWRCLVKLKYKFGWVLTAEERSASLARMCSLLSIGTLSIKRTARSSSGTMPNGSVS